MFRSVSSLPNTHDFHHLLFFLMTSNQISLWSREHVFHDGNTLKFVEILVMVQCFGFFMYMETVSMAVAGRMFYMSVLTSQLTVLKSSILSLLFICLLAVLVNELCVKISYCDCRVVYFSLYYARILLIFSYTFCFKIHCFISININTQSPC